ncbi:hypothetical protein BDR07DRAFT_1374922 [Suillus spraguei]|nr:hypothetical protein BDR07DRAFT_1374922 [Suillus spraguei]
MTRNIMGSAGAGNTLENNDILLNLLNSMSGRFGSDSTTEVLRQSGETCDSSSTVISPIQLLCKLGAMDVSSGDVLVDVTLTVVENLELQLLLDGGALLLSSFQCKANLKYLRIHSGMYQMLLAQFQAIEGDDDLTVLLSQGVVEPEDEDVPLLPSLQDLPQNAGLVGPAGFQYIEGMENQPEYV